jgi:predicted ATPase with chaperone activity
MSAALALTPRRSTGRLTEPASIAELCLERSLVWDLALKTLFYRGRLSRAELSAELKLSSSVMEEVMSALSYDNLATVLGASTAGPSGYVYALTDKGRERAETALARSGYVGPAPVSLDDYVAQVSEQSVGEAHVTREDLQQALGTLVLSDQTMSRLGRAAASRRSTLVHGPSGNGKSTAVRALGHAIGGTIRIPHAIDVVGHIVHLYDPSKHVVAEEETGEVDGPFSARPDRRWLTIERPVIWAGGELTKHSLEFVYDDAARVYEAPLQLKANGGTLIIDDFGRQQIPAVQLLNRWITALEGGTDHLTLHTGQTIEVPFDVMVLFSTNLAPQELADDAFLRRIRYKVAIPNPSEIEYRAIFRNECVAAGISPNEGVVSHLLETWYAPHQRELRGCHPRDLIGAIMDACSYEGRTPALGIDLLDEVCSTYFLQPA